MNGLHDEDSDLSDILWDLHFTMNRIVTGVVEGCYTLPGDVVLGLSDARESVPQTLPVNWQGRRKSVKKSLPGQSPLTRSAMFHRLVLQAHVLRDKMNELMGCNE